jgi:hypothetical protein
MIESIEESEITVQPLEHDNADPSSLEKGVMFPTPELPEHAASVARNVEIASMLRRIAHYLALVPID